MNMFGESITVLGPKKTQKKHSTDKTTVKTHETINDQGSATLYGADPLILKSKRDAEKDEVNMGLDTGGTFHEDSGHEVSL